MLVWLISVVVLVDFKAHLSVSVADLSGCIGGLLGKPWCWLWVMLTVVMDGKSTPWCWYGCWQWLYMWF